jgi:hypothetical protein
MHAPPEQRWPTEQAGPFPQTQPPSLAQVSAVAPQLPQIDPFAPQVDGEVLSQSPAAVQHPAQDVESQRH